MAIDVGKKDEKKVEMKPERKKRVPLGILRTKLNATVPDGYVGRWVNDKPGRLKDAEAAGYEYATDPNIEVGSGDASERPGIGSAISRVVGTHEDGSSLRSYLMMIPKDLYQEDQEEKMRQLDEREEGIRRGQDGQGRPGKDGRYIPGTGIKIDHGKS